ncbi:MAG: POTRA domain-containing protein, partial [Bacteroidota bacterium]
MPEKVQRFLLIIFLFISISSTAQVQITGTEELMDYSNPKEYEIGGLTVSGVQFLDESALITLTGLTIGEKIRIPGDDISDAINNLWKQGLLADIKVIVKKVEGKLIFLDFALQERPRLSKFSFEGVSKGEADKLREKLGLVTGKVITENLKQNTVNKVKDHFVEKGFLFVEVNVSTSKDTSALNSEIMTVVVTNKKRIKVNDIIITGNTEFSEKKIRRKMKGTKEKGFYKIFTSSKFNETGFATDKEKIVEAYKDRGFRDARIVRDSVYRYDRKTVNVEMTIDEGHKYYFRNITWVGNTKYSTSLLSQLLGVKAGDIYSQQRLDEGLIISQSGRDVTSLYMDDGYLFFQVTPVEIRVDGDSIDLEMRIYEGKQARINNVTVSGNTKTNDKVILREIRTKPGELFSRSDIIRTQRELAQLGYFDQEKLGVNPKPNPENGTVDIDYVVEERPSDQLQLSGGWGAGQVV